MRRRSGLKVVLKMAHWVCGCAVAEVRDLDGCFEGGWMEEWREGGLEKVQKIEGGSPSLDLGFGIVRRTWWR